ncbi:hypothetical protein [Myxococcus landrumensis]|uniref:Uncharacterized protein n=1 Tax=Myxococcus landrumensis TaxID=2813577 RepID=A0ABX7N5N4_9BACT|nr:hypothetical protein [Myxococcus landrumus]QSQ14057.1 hypothetical protein JY572_38045 [Myxococcus landrumus]
MLVKLDAYEDGSPIIVAADSVESLRLRWRAQDVVTVRTKSGGEELVRGNLADVAAKLGFTGTLGTETPAPSETETTPAETGVPA